MERDWASYRLSADKALQQNKLEHAETLLYAALMEAEEFPDGDPRLTVTLELLGEVLFQQNKFAMAEPIVERTIKIYETNLGAQHPDVGVLVNNLAMLFHMQSKFEDAEICYKKALDILTKSLGANHPEVINLLSNYAKMLFQTHREAEAEHMRACIKGLHTGRWTRSGSHKAFVANTDQQVSTSTTATAAPATQAPAVPKPQFASMPLPPPPQPVPQQPMPQQPAPTMQPSPAPQPAMQAPPPPNPYPPKPAQQPEQPTYPATPAPQPTAVNLQQPPPAPAPYPPRNQAPPSLPFPKKKTAEQTNEAQTEDAAGEQKQEQQKSGLGRLLQSRKEMTN